VPPSKTDQTSPLFKADVATLSFYATKDGKVSVSYPGWDDRKVVLPGQVFEIAWAPQGVEGRIRQAEGPDTRVAVPW
jgi:hypothetical protein